MPLDRSSCRKLRGAMSRNHRRKSNANSVAPPQRPPALGRRVEAVSTIRRDTSDFGRGERDATVEKERTDATNDVSPRRVGKTGIEPALPIKGTRPST